MAEIMSRNTFYLAMSDKACDVSDTCMPRVSVLALRLPGVKIRQVSMKIVIEFVSHLPQEVIFSSVYSACTEKWPKTPAIHAVDPRCGVEK